MSISAPATDTLARSPTTERVRGHVKRRVVAIECETIEATAERLTFNTDSECWRGLAKYRVGERSRGLGGR